LNLISLFPPTWHNRPNGLRPDIATALDEIKGKFLRMPGGNNLEGDETCAGFGMPLSARSRTVLDVSARGAMKTLMASG